MVSRAIKLTKAEARYRPWPMGTQRCGLCTMFREPDACTDVQRDEDGVSPNGWCKLFYAKGAS